MRPPDCSVCHLTLHDMPDDGRDYFTLVTFGATEEALDPFLDFIADKIVTESAAAQAAPAAAAGPAPPGP